ncbi:MAG TPA: hypothetical protein VIR98_00895 [Candidatus Paceibacterota bacterium]|jgi:hypothetical protein
MNQIFAAIVGLVIIVIAWKLLKGVLKFAIIIAVVAAAAYFFLR